MIHAKLIIAIIIGVLCTPFLSSHASASARYSQIVLPFSNERAFNFYFHEADNAIVLEIESTTLDELGPLDNHDESLVRRITLKESGTKTEVRIVLRDHDTRATVLNYREPFRIVIDLFDKNFQEQRDAKTGFPYANQPDADKTAPSNAYPRGAIAAQYQGQRPLRGVPRPMAGTAPQSSSDGESSDHKRRLLQPTPQNFANPSELVQTLSKIPSGMGSGWKQFPPYIYRIELAPFKGGKNYKDFLSKNATQAVTSMTAMADYAAKLFDAGDESRALSAYQHVIHKDPLLFDKRPLHLWRLAEIHLGQGNLTLADGYYQAMTKKHPDHPLANFAEMRRLDIKALRLIKKGVRDGYDIIAGYLDPIDPRKDEELRAQLAIRKVYWTQTPDTNKILITNNKFIPTLSEKSRSDLQASYNNIENDWTAFLMATLMLNDHLSPAKPWTKQTAELAIHYFKNYTGSKVDPFSSNLRDKLTNKINRLITDQVANNDYLGAINIYESLDDRLKQLPHSAKTSWSLAQAYRLLGQSTLSIPHYEKAAKNLENSVNRFRSVFWLMIALTDSLNEKISAGNNNPAGVEDQTKKQAASNTTLWKMWQELKPDERRQILISMRSPFESIVKSEAILSTPAKILLEAWNLSLNTKVKDTLSDTEKLRATYAATSETVGVLIALSEKFKKLGLDKEWEQARFLLSKINPKSLEGNKELEDTWAKSLIELAEYYRVANRYLDAGRIYSLTGSNSQNWEGRAEALYKGGLLLFRAGRRQEALDALTKASQDGNNLLYSELAKKRLEQLNN